MSTYAIGDIQGCYRELQQLLERVQFNEHGDSLWLCGDLVNRGPDSLAVLRFLKSLGERAVAVLGNHDLHCLAVLAAGQSSKGKDTLDALAVASDRDELLAWLRAQPLLHYDRKKNVAMVHAGIPPCWDLDMAEQLAREVEQQLQASDYQLLLREMYGNKPKRWDDSLVGIERYRFIINACTRMRLLDQDHSLNLKAKSNPAANTELVPWYTTYPQDTSAAKIVFGHWAALGGGQVAANVEALDTGCVWGGSLTALCLDTWQRFSVRALPSD